MKRRNFWTEGTQDLHALWLNLHVQRQQFFEHFQVLKKVAYNLVECLPEGILPIEAANNDEDKTNDHGSDAHNNAHQLLT